MFNRDDFVVPHKQAPTSRRMRLLLLALIALLLLAIWSSVRQRAPQPLAAGAATEARTATPSPAISLPPSAVASGTPTPSVTPVYEEVLKPFFPLGQGLILLSFYENEHSHLFAYQPEARPFVRLTAGDWDDITPALSPDHNRLAFASNRDGQWDLYLLELASGGITRLTETRDYEASPTWSPDGQFLAYEGYSEAGGLDIYIRPVDQPQEPIRLTREPGLDFEPAWSPRGRQLAFVSNRSGDNEIWLADLDKATFQNISRDEKSDDTRPVWALDGSRLAWAAGALDDMQAVKVWNPDQPNLPARPAANGNWGVFSPSGDALLVSLDTPNRAFLTAFSSQDSALALPALALPGPISGLVWTDAALPDPLPESYTQSALVTAPALVEAQITPADLPSGRQQVVPLNDVQAPSAMLSDLVDDSFIALRSRLAQIVGWDLLASLENAYVPLTSPLSPGMMEDWLYTGRAFAVNPLVINAGWMQVVREDYGPQTYWRLYLRTRFQDGSQGMPLRTQPWNLYARASGNPRAYEQGGAWLANVPGGYWYDFTTLAQAYGWERLPALSAWRSSYSASRFNELAFTGRLDWFSAMLEVYPREALDTPTPVPTSTPTPTNTPWPSATRYMSPTPWPTRTPKPTNTRYPTYTPKPSPTKWPTITPKPTKTPWPTPTPKAPLPVTGLPEPTQPPPVTLLP